ncbi:putative PRAME family member 26 isoform X2 [Canis lupus familiaris]|uniref:putative PRAME family member 26 isoform X2 n=1 Tax=Canis lupus familiaris TaxID=9615 RepID=UPI0018F40879|nr:putative PRAME family member 26 isoform X2 [Canis lupus familiaris]
MPFNSLIGILKILNLDFIQELEVFDWFWALSEQSLFATQLGRICNQQGLKLACYHWAFSSEPEQPSSSCQQSYQVLMWSPFHQRNCVGGVGREPRSHLQEPLHSLEIRSCTWASPTCLRTFHTASLKKLDLSGDNLSYMVPGPLETLLEEVSGTPQHLYLKHCQLKDADQAAEAVGDHAVELPLWLLQLQRGGSGVEGSGSSPGAPGFLGGSVLSFLFFIFIFHFLFCVCVCVCVCLCVCVFCVCVVFFFCALLPQLQASARFRHPFVPVSWACDRDSRSPALGELFFSSACPSGHSLVFFFWSLLLGRRKLGGSLGGSEV